MAEDLTLNVIVPTTIKDSVLISSTAAENDYAVWSAATTYAAGQLVIVAATHRIYESGKASNLGNDPTIAINRTGTPPWWIDVSPTNRWAMFDGLINTATTVATPLTVVLQPGFIGAMYLSGLVAENISISIKDAPGGTVVYTYSDSLENSQPPDYWEYFFSPFRQQDDLFLSDIPPYSNMEVTVTISSVSGNVSCGFFSVGDLRPLGMTEWDAEAQPKTYSYIVDDKYGNNKIIRRPSAKNMRLTAEVDIVNADYVEETVRLLQDIPVVCIGVNLENYAGLRVVGLISGALVYKNARQCFLNLTVKGFI